MTWKGILTLAKEGDFISCATCRLVRVCNAVTRRTQVDVGKETDPMRIALMELAAREGPSSRTHIVSSTIHCSPAKPCARAQSPLSCCECALIICLSSVPTHARSDSRVCVSAMPWCLLAVACVLTSFEIRVQTSECSDYAHSPTPTTGKIPFIIRRTLPNGTSEDWAVNELVVEHHALTDRYK